MSQETKKTIHSSFWANIFRSPTEADELIAVLKEIPIFKSFSLKEITGFLNVLHERNYLAGEYIFYQGDPGIGLYIIRDGEVMISRENEIGIKITLAVFQKGDFFGELALIDNDKRSASAIAQTDAKLSVIFKSDLDEYIDNYPKKGIKILRGIAEITAQRLRNLNEDYFNLRTEKNNGG